MKTHAYSSRLWWFLSAAFALTTAEAQDPNSTITIQSITSQAAEAFSTPGKFMIRRTGGTNFSQLIFYQLSGTASNGLDYDQLSGTIQMPAGASAVPLMINPIDDSLIEGTETVVARITASPLQCATCGYDIGQPDTADVIIYDNDINGANTPPSLFFYMPQNGATFTGPTNITLRAYADDNEDRFFVRVEFFEGANGLGFGTFQPALCPAPYCPYFDLVWSNVPPGQYTFTARATDSHGLSSNSAPAVVTVRDAADCSRIIITTHPQSHVVLDNCLTTFSVAAAGTSPYIYQWFRDDQPISDATNSSYTFRVSVADSGARFHATVANACSSAASAQASLYISLDVVPPTLLRARGDASLQRVIVAFAVGGCAEGPGLDPASAEDIYNYSITGGITISDALLDASGTVVTLTTGTQRPGSLYTLRVEGVRDLRGNTIPDGSQTVFQSWVILPGSDPPRVVPPPMAISRSGTNIVIDWPHGSLLQVAKDLTGPWDDLPYAPRPYKPNLAVPAQFYRTLFSP